MIRVIKFSLLFLFLLSCNEDNNSTGSLSTSFQTTTVSLTSPGVTDDFQKEFDIVLQIEDYEITNNFEINIYYFIDNQDASISTNDFIFHRCDDFKIMKYPVTNSQYANYLNTVVDVGLKTIEGVPTLTTGIETRAISLPSVATGIQRIEILAFDPAQNIVAESTTQFSNQVGTGYFVSGTKVKGVIDLEESITYYDSEVGEVLFDGNSGGFRVESGKENFPLVGITWNGAVDFANFFEFNIPTQDQWSFAAKGPEDWIYPWNSSSYTNYANYDNLHSNSTMEVGSFSGNGALRYSQSYCGLFDMTGNIWQFTSSPGLIENTYIVTGSSGSDMRNSLKVDDVSSIWPDISTQSHGFRMVAPTSIQTADVEGCMSQSSCSYGEWVDIQNDEMCFENDCDGNCNGEAFNDSCNECVGGATGLSEGYSIDCMGLCGGEAFIDNCNICVMGTSPIDTPNCITIPGLSTDSKCQQYMDTNPDYTPWSEIDYIASDANQIDCSGVCLSGESSGCVASIFNTFDDCGNNNAMLDDCNLCYGGIATNQVPSESDCNGDCNGEAEIDCCGNCVGGETGQSIDSCEGSTKDSCGVCTGGEFDGCVAGEASNCGYNGNDNDKDCNGNCFGSALTNECGCVGGETGYEENYCYGCDNIYADNYWCNKTPGLSCIGFPFTNFIQNCRDECISTPSTPYYPDYIQDDGSCEFSGCPDPSADNFGLQSSSGDLIGSNSNQACSQAVSGEITGACINDGSCQYVGCTNENAPNYNSGANLDNGLCLIGSICKAQGSNSNTVDVNFTAIENIYGFELTISGRSIESASSSLAESEGFTLSVSESKLIAFSLSGSYISSTEGTLVSIQFESDVNASDILIDEWVISGEGGKNLVFTSSGECAP